MNYKIEGAIRRNKTNFIIYAIIWLIIAIVVIPTFTYSWNLAKETGELNLISFLGTFGTSIFHPIDSIKNVIKIKVGKEYVSNLLTTTVIYTIAFFIGFVKSAPKNRYTDIEHGSSEWCQGGEQYKILSKKKGIILAQNNYLPVDKKGNVNVLVVGRFRCW